MCSITGPQMEQFIQRETCCKALVLPDVNIKMIYTYSLTSVQILTEKTWNQVGLKSTSLPSWVSALTIHTTQSICFCQLKLELNIAFQVPHHRTSYGTFHTEGDTLCCKALALPDVNIIIYMYYLISVQFVK